MTQIEVIRMIGDVLTEIDVTVGSLMPGDPAMVKLQDRRRLLDARQLTLSRQVFDDNTKRFQEAAAELQAVEKEVSLAIRRIDNMTAVIQNVTRFLDAVTSFMGTIGAFG
jgi:cell division septal protein FtsQ